MQQLKKTAVAIAVVGGVLLGASQTVEAARINYGAIINGVTSGVTSYIGGPFAQILNNMITQVMAQSTATLGGEINKAAVANKVVLEGLEAYRQQEELRKESIELAAKYELPANTCADMAAQDGIGKAGQANQAAIARSQEAVAKAIKGNTNTLRTIDALHEKSNERYCSREDGQRGLCTFNDQNELAGADQDAMFLFQARSGSRTFSASRGNGPSQYDAAGDYIQRVVAGIPPEQLRTKDLDKTPQGRAYIELVRRYNSMLSMSSYSLNQIREAGNPIKGLGNTTQLANVEGFAPEVDMSMNEALRRFVANQFSPKVVKDLSTATQPEKILRAMATQNSFGLWMDYQSLEQNARIEGLLANQLALVAEQTLKPQIEAQRAVASRSPR